MTSSVRIEEEEEAQPVAVEGIGPINVDWWVSEINSEARTFRSTIFPYDGQEVAAMVLIVIAGLGLAALVSADVDFLWSLAGVGLSMLGLLVGPAAWEFVRRLRDPYHNKYHEAALTVIDRVGGQNERQLKKIAMKHLENVDESEAEDSLEECAFELAETCRWDASYLTG